MAYVSWCQLTEFVQLVGLPFCLSVNFSCSKPFRIRMHLENKERNSPIGILHLSCSVSSPECQSQHWPGFWWHLLQGHDWIGPMLPPCHPSCYGIVQCIPLPRVSVSPVYVAHPMCSDSPTVICTSMKGLVNIAGNIMTSVAAHFFHLTNPVIFTF